MKSDRELLIMLIEAIDYSFWNPTDRKYNMELTWPVIDKVNYIKGILSKTNQYENIYPKGSTN